MSDDPVVPPADDPDEMPRILVIPVEKSEVTTVQNALAPVLLSCKTTHIVGLIALANLALAVADDLLARCPLELFEANRAQVQRVLAIMQEHMETTRPTADQLAASAPPSTTH